MTATKSMAGIMPIYDDNEAVANQLSDSPMKNYDSPYKMVMACSSFLGKIDNGDSRRYNAPDDIEKIQKEIKMMNLKVIRNIKKQNKKP
jgi:hypothetical protein